MNILGLNEPLTEAELDRLGNFLAVCNGGRAMNVEEIDGFFAALIAGPELIMPSEYFPQVFGCSLAEVCEFGSLEEVQEIIGLLMRHWNTIAGTLNRDEVHELVLLENENGVATGTDWAEGFMQGMDSCHDGWAELLDDDEHGGCLVPVLMLHHEHDEDPRTRTNPIGPKQREKVILHMAAGLVKAYRYFRERRLTNPCERTARRRSNTLQCGRNDPCPCGSGRKYKRCCGGATVN